MTEKPISKELMDILACPNCKSELKLSEEGNQLICIKCKQKYEIKEGIPVLTTKETPE